MSMSDAQKNGDYSMSEFQSVGRVLRQTHPVAAGFRWHRCVTSCELAAESVFIVMNRYE